MVSPTERTEPTRRAAIGAIGVGALAGLSGCLGAVGLDGGDAPEPVDLGGGKLDYHGGMEIGMHGGPNGQVFYADNEPEPMHDGSSSPDARDDLAWFHTLVHGLFPYHLRRRERGWEAAAVYVTDYSAIEWELSERDGNEVMPAPTNPESFAPASELTYVADSDVMGGMGPALIPFSEAGDAESFTGTHGGETVAFGDITRQMIRALQRSG
jgi:nitrous oxide reductase accessory protein NosL